MDLKSVAQDVLQEATPFLGTGEQTDAAASDAFVPEANVRSPLLTQSMIHPTTAANTPETTMADEITTPDEPPVSVVAAIDVPKKQRKPRAKKVNAETASVEIEAQTALAKKPRGRKPKLDGDASSAKSAAVRRGPKRVLAAVAAPNVAIDDMTGILQLEEENQRLRKLVAEKLRAENADLRKRLNLD